MSQCHLAQVIPTHSSCSSSFMPSVASLLSSFFMPGVASSLSFSFMPGVACGMRGRLPSCAAVFRPVRYGLRYVRRSSVLPGAACAVVFHSARQGMRSILPFCPGRHARRSSVLPGAAYAEVFRSVWRGLVCAAVFRSVWRSPVRAAVFRAARCDIGVLFCLARPSVRGGPQFCPAWQEPRSSVLIGAVFFCSARGGMHGGVPFCLARPSMRGGVPFRPGRHAWRCSVLSNVAQCARRCCGSVIGGPRSLVALPDDPVIIGAIDPRSQRCSCHTAQRCVKVGQGR